MHRPLQIISSAFVLNLFFTLNASAQLVTEGLCDPQLPVPTTVDGPNGTKVTVSNCRQPILDLIDAEQQGIDVAFWFMEDSRYASHLVNWHNNHPNKPIRVLVDERANGSKPLNAQVLQQLKDAGIPMREKIPDPDYNPIQILHLKMMLFHGQDVVEFSKANYADAEFVPINSRDFNDEAIFFTNDSRITNSFRQRFDDLWTNTSSFQNYANVTGSLLRNYPECPPPGGTCIDAAMNFPGENDQSTDFYGQPKNFQERAKSRFDAETGAVDAMVFRITDGLLPDAIIKAVARGVTVRIITDDGEYNNPDRRWDAKHIDNMYMVGVNSGGKLKIKIGDRGTNPDFRQRPNMTAHDGIAHEAVVILHDLDEVIFGSSNWTTPSAYKQDEHNFFLTPGFGKQWFFDWFDDQFNRKWNDSVNFPDFTPLPPGTPSYAAPLSGATGVATTSVTLKWEGGPWAHFYDIYFGTTSTPPLLAGNKLIGSPDDGIQEKYTISNLQPGTTYYWRIVSRTYAQKTKTGPTWSFTTAGSSGGGGGGSTPFTGTPAAIPGMFQAENFDNGGQGVSWNDTTPGNTGGACARSTATDVDMETTTDTGGGCDVGWTKAGEWLNYTVNIATTGTYTFSARVANTGTGGNFHLLVDGVDKATISVPNTGGWQAWQTVTQTGVSLNSGQHVVRIVFSTASSNGGIGNYNWFQLTLP
jgi:carbohydrate binding protein with CBM6 domain/phospholipase D-like protein